MTNYKKGRTFEYRVRDTFRDFGFKAERKAASSPYDVIIMNEHGDVVFLVDAKKTSQRDKDYIYLKKEDLEKIIRESKKFKAQPLMTYGFYRTPIYIGFPNELLEEDGKTVRVEGGMILEKFLENYDL